MNVMALLSAANQSLLAAGTNFEAINTATAPFYKQLNTLGIYEQRRSRAAKDTLARFQELVAAREKALAEAAAAFKAMKSQNKPFDPSEFGFVHSSAEIESFLARQSARANLKQSPSQTK
jgi:capsule polysaccharide export protein KpsE/RkpR